MRPATEEFLYFLLWTADSLARPTWRNLNDSFEAWAYRNRLDRRLAELARRKLVERSPDPSIGRVVRLTAAGRLAALGGRDPIVRWDQPWDGRWRLLLFDLPSTEMALRTKLRRLLRAGGFGYLQHSVWVTPNPPDDIRAIVAAGPGNPESLLLFEGQPSSGESAADIVNSAWDFAEINRRYEAHGAVLRACPAGPLDSAANRTRLHAWARRERLAWHHAVSLDPLLPNVLHPPGYRGRRAWNSRAEVFAHLGSPLPSPK